MSFERANEIKVTPAFLNMFRFKSWKNIIVKGKSRMLEFLGGIAHF